MRYIPIIVMLLALATGHVTAAVKRHSPGLHSWCWYEVHRILPGMKSPPSGVYETDCGILAVWL